MDNPGRTSIQATVKSVCSISYVSEKLQVSRPTLYKYMELTGENFHATLIKKYILSVHKIYQSNILKIVTY